MQLEDSLYYLCSLIEFIGRKTKNRRKDVVSYLGDKAIQKIFELSDVYHCEQIEKVADDFIASSHIPDGSFDNVGDCDYSVPNFWSIGRVYSSLVYRIMERKNLALVDAVRSAFDSKAGDLISDFNGLFFCENPDNIYITWDTGIVE